MKIRNLYDVFVQQLKDVYSAEKQLIDLFPQMIDAAHSESLNEALRQDFQQSKADLETVQTLLSDLNENPGNTVCKAAEGLVTEAEEIAGLSGSENAKDAAIIVAMQKFYHYKISTYGSLRTFARLLSRVPALTLMRGVLDEAYVSDNRLNQIAMGGLFRSGINDKAQKERVA